ncbi:MAG: flagellar basal-body MS-ring/collar protein FliF [Bacillota bacterium]
MNDKVKEIIEKIKLQYANLSPKLRKMILIIGGGVLVLSIGLAVFLNNRPYETLFAGLEQSEAQEIMIKLQDREVDYQYSDGAILVESELAYQLKAELALEGYPKQGSTYDIFGDNVGMMSTDFENQQYSLYQLQESIAATIRKFDGVSDAEVYIVLAEEQKYVLDSTAKQEATASVTVFMKNGMEVSSELVKGIQHLVSYSIPGVQFESVGVVDGFGNTVTYQDRDEATTANEIKIELEEYMENTIREKVLNILGPIYGNDNITVSAKATVDIDKKISEISNYSPPIPDYDRGIIYHESSAVEFDRDGEAIGGVPGVENNAEIPTYGNIPLDGTETYYSGQAAVDYYVNQLKEQIQTDAGSLEDLTISVAINGEDLGALDEAAVISLVGNATGIAVNLQDEKITVVAAPFYMAYDPDADVVVVEETSNFIIIGAIIAGVLLFLMIMFILMMRRKKKQQQLAEEEMNLIIPPTDNSKLEEEYLKRMIDKQQNDVEERLLSLSTEASNELREKAREIAEQSPSIAAQLIRAWLNGLDGVDPEEGGEEDGS